MKFLSTLVANILGTFIAIGLLLFVGFLLVIALVAASDTTPSVRSGSVLVLDLEGTVPERVSGDPTNQLFGGESPYGLADLIDGIERAGEDRRIEGLWIRPGMVTIPWSSMEAIKRAIETFKASGKPVYASSDAYYVRENEYFLMSAADRVFLDPESIFEYNGFALETMFYADLMDRVGIEPVVIRSGTYKSAIEPFTRTDLSDANREQLQALVDGIEAVFLQGVAVGRGIQPDQLRSLMDEEAMITAQRALSAGLVDTLAHDNDVRVAFLRAMGRDLDERLPTVSIASFARAGAAGIGSAPVAVVHVDGMMVAGDGDVVSPLGGGDVAASGRIIRAIRDAARASSTKAVVLRIDSPGGFAPAADAMRAAVDELDPSIPVIVSMGSMAASGGYWLAAAGDYIVAESTTITGSIGVFTMTFDVERLLNETLGIDTDNVTSGPYGDMMSGYRAPSPAELRLLQDQADGTYERFLQVVATARGMTVGAVDSVAQGRVWLGQDALEMGLVDEIGGLDRAIRIAAERAGLEENDVRTAHFPAPETFVERFTRSMGAVVAPRVALPEPLARRVAQLETLSGMSGRPQALLPFSVTWR